MAIPFIGRLRPYEYLALVGSFLLVGLEAVIRVLTLALRELQTDSKRCRNFD
jgi:lysosomal acid lipase/cholesteryl ester hydrolase